MSTEYAVAEMGMHAISQAVFAAKVSPLHPNAFNLQHVSICTSHNCMGWCHTCKAADALQKLQVLSQFGGVAALVAVLLVQLALSRARLQLSRLQPKQVPQVLRTQQP